MNPVAPVLVLFDKELVEILMDLFRVTNQDKGILDGLLCPITANVNGTTSQVIGGGNTTYFLIQLGATIAGVNNNRCESRCHEIDILTYTAAQN